MNDDDAATVIMQLYYLMDEVAQDRLDQIWEKGRFVQEGYKKKPTKKGRPIENVVNTIIGSVQREVKTSMTKLNSTMSSKT